MDTENIMGNFKRDGDRGFGGNRGGSRGGNFRRNGFNKGGFGGGNRFGGDRNVVMHDAVCDECKKNCQIPFRPSSDKPIYCKDCFMKRGGGPSRPSFGNGPRRDSGDRPQRDNFSANRGGGNDDIKRQLEAISAKLDNLVRAIEGISKKAPEVKEKKAEEKAVEVKAKEVKPKPKAKVTKKVGKK